MKQVVYIFITIFFTTLQLTYADDTTKTDTTKADTTIINDTIIFTNTKLLTGISPVTDSTNFEKHLYQNPTTALFKSMVLPGWGQFGNKKKIKALFFVSFDLWMISKALDHRKQARDLWDTYNSFDDVATRTSYYNLYTQERNRRNKYTWYAVITSFFAMFDAYVDAHLSGFPKENEQKFSLDFIPSEITGTKISLSFKF